MFIYQEFNPSEPYLTLSASLRDVTSSPKFSRWLLSRFQAKYLHRS